MSENSADKLCYVRLDVGHHLYLCHRDKLSKYPESYLAKLVAPEFDKRSSSNEFIVVDRDGEHFGRILEYLDDENSINMKHLREADLVKLKNEANFYCLDGLEEKCVQALDGIRKGLGSKSYITILVDYENYLKTSDKPVFLLSKPIINRLVQMAFLDKLSLLCDHDLYDLIGCNESFEELRLYAPKSTKILLAYKPTVVRTHEDSQETDWPPSVHFMHVRPINYESQLELTTNKLCSFLLKINQQLREMDFQVKSSQLKSSNKGGHLSDLD